MIHLTTSAQRRIDQDYVKALEAAVGSLTDLLDLRHQIEDLERAVAALSASLADGADS